MCGIIGYVGDEDGVQIVLDGLKRLEYRGYDSWGIAGLEHNQVMVIKRTGKIGKITRADVPLGTCHSALGHTRWATHGGVTERNAHPHLSAGGRIAVVHNGIIENYQQLRAELVASGVHLVSETDSEIVPNLIERHLDAGKDFAEAIMLAIRALEGSFAIVVLDEQTGAIAGARNGSPLVLGTSSRGAFLASDVPAFLAHTRTVTYLDDGDLAIIDNGVRIISYEDGRSLTRPSEEVSWDLEQAQKGSYAHFMRKEIDEQGRTIHAAIEQDPATLAQAVKMIREAFGVFFVGAGTSYHACVSASYVFAEVAKKHVNVITASEFRNYQDFLTDRTLLIAVSQSGETADLLDAIRVAKAKGVKVLSIVNVMGSSLMRRSDHTILMNAGPEICVLSTKSYTSQLAILLLLGYALAGREGEARALLGKAADAVPGILAASEPIAKALAHRIKGAHDLFLIGRDLAYPSALEGALKIKEVSYIHAEGFAGGELKHGTIALIEDGVPVIVLTTEATRPLILSNAMEVRSRGGYIIGVNAHPNELYDTFFKVPALGSADPLVMILPVQLLAYHLALARGLDPDKPRNLAKSVTVK